MADGDGIGSKIGEMAKDLGKGALDEAGRQATTAVKQVFSPPQSTNSTQQDQQIEELKAADTEETSAKISAIQKALHEQVQAWGVSSTSNQQPPSGPEIPKVRQVSELGQNPQTNNDNNLPPGTRTGSHETYKRQG